MSWDDDKKHNEIIAALESIEANQPSLRDRFAMAAMNGLLSANKSFSFSTVTSQAYKIADDMLKSREKTNE